MAKLKKETKNLLEPQFSFQVKGIKDDKENDFCELNSVDIKVVKSLEEKSDEDYRIITNRIIDITKENIDRQTEQKETMRKPLTWFVGVLLFAQFIVLVVILFGNTCCFNIPETVINTYIISVFAETLVGLIVIIKFAFDSKQEVNLIEVLNTIVSKFQKYKSGNSNEDYNIDDKPNGS